MGEYKLNFSATGTKEFGEAARSTTDALDKQEANAKRMVRWQNELAKLAQARRQAAQAELPVQAQLEKALERRARIEERIARAQSNPLRATALRLQRGRNEANIRDLQGRLPDADHGPGVLDTLQQIPAVGFAASALKGLAGLGKFLPGAVMAAAAVGFYKITKSAIETARSLVELSDSTQISIGDLKALTQAAKGTQTEFDVVLGTFQALKQAQGQLNAGIGRGQARLKAFEVLGISQEDLRSKEPLALFRELIAKMKEGTITSEQYAAGVRLLGDGFGRLIPAAKKGLGDLVAEMANANKQMSDGQVLLFEKMGRLWDTFFFNVGKKAKSLKNTLVTGATTLGELGLAAIANLFASNPLWDFKELRDKLLLSREQTYIGTGERQVEENEKVLADKIKTKQSASDIAGYKSELRGLLGEDAEDVIDGLEEGSMRPEDYAKAVRRARRQANRGGGSSGGSAPNVDALQKIGLFVGGGPNAAVTVLRQQEQHLSRIEQNTRTLNDLLPALKGQIVTEQGKFVDINI
jgi:hypothetical protein